MTNEERGRQAAKKEIQEDGWTRAMALDYLGRTEPLATGEKRWIEYDLGFRAAIEEFSK